MSDDVMLPPAIRETRTVSDGNSQGGADARLDGIRLALARAIWLAVVLLTLGLFVLAVPIRYIDLLTTTPSGDNALVILSPVEASFVIAHGASLNLYALYFIAFETFFAAVYIVMGSIIFFRKSRDGLAMFASLTLITFGVLVPGTVRVFDVPASPLQIPLHVIQNWGWVSFAACFYLFPDGRFVPRGTRFAPILFIGWAIEWLVTPYANPFNWPLPIALLAFFGLFSAGVLAQIYRYRYVSTLSQRTQTRWVIFAFAVATFGTLLFLAPPLVAPMLTEPGSGRVLYHVIGVPVFAFSLLLIPVNLDIAIRRYRLWSIDPLINRAVVYFSLTSLLIAIYSSSVIILQQLFRVLTGFGNDVAIIASTLAIAGLFNPLRSRIQNVIDRRFFRRKYDAQKVLVQFAHTARDETDLEKLTDELIRVVDETMYPESVSVWLRTPEVKR